MTNTDDTTSATYDEVAGRLAEDDEPYAYLFGFTMQTLRGLLQRPDDAIARKQAQDVLRAYDDHRAKVRAEMGVSLRSYEQESTR